MKASTKTAEKHKKHTEKPTDRNMEAKNNLDKIRKDWKTCVILSWFGERNQFLIKQIKLYEIRAWS